MRKQDFIQRAKSIAGAPLAISAVALITVVAGCGGGGGTSGTTCHNLPIATGLVGQTSFSNGGQNATTSTVSANGFSGPTSSVASNVAGTLFYVADTGNNRILGYTSLPSPTALGVTNASFVIGQPDLSSNSPGTSATALAAPTKVSVSDDGTTLVVADSNNNRVLLYSPLPTSTGATPSVILGQGSATTKTTAYGCSGTELCATSLYNPTAAMIAGGQLIVVDQNNNRALVWTTVPTATGTAANVVIGEPDFTTGQGVEENFYDYTNQKILMEGPTDLYTDGFKLYISDTQNNRVLYWNQIPQTNYTNATYVIGQLVQTGITKGLSSQAFNAPAGLWSDGSNLFVADVDNNRVLMFTSPATDNDPVATGVFGQQDFTHGTQNDPDQNSVPGYQENNVIIQGPFGSTLFGPSGVWVPPSSSPDAGYLYVTDTSNNRILIYPISTAVNGSDTTNCALD